jgi:hypothetical protein
VMRFRVRVGHFLLRLCASAQRRHRAGTRYDP